MKNVSHIFKVLPRYRMMSLLIIFAFSFSCTSRKKTPSAQSNESLRLQETIPYTQNPFANQKNPLSIQKTLQNTWIHTIDPDVLWAITHCRCAPEISSKYLQSLSRTFGALPETLVPDVRERILNDPKLKIIDRVPGGLRDIADFFVGVYVTDGKIAEEVKAGVDEMIQKSVPGSSLLSQKHPYRFDLYSNLNLPDKIRIPESPKAFSVGDQSVIWSHIFSQNNMWEGKDPMAFGDHGFQFLMTLKSLAEWKYLFGLDKSVSLGRTYGGLTFDAKSGASRSGLAPYDPRLVPTPPSRFVSGQYQVQYPDTKALDMALKVNETWVPSGVEASLMEQSLLLYSSAQALSRLRPRNQTKTRSMYETQGGVIPNDAFLLPIAFLPGTATALETFFINQKELEIYQIGDKPAEITRDRIKANLPTVSRLMAAMMAWVKETENIDDLNTSDSIRSQLLSGRETMLKLLRLTSQTFLAEFVREDNIQRTPFGISMVQNSSSLQLPRLAEAAEALAILAQVEQEVLPSALLRQRIFQLYHWMAATYYPRLVQGQIGDLRADDIIWARQALQRFAFYPDAGSTVWFKDAYDTLSRQLSNWDGRAL